MTTRPEHRALPGPMGGLIRDGVARRDLTALGDRAVWRALCSTATSAIQRGWTYPEWVAYLSEAKSALGRQVRIRGGKRERSNTQYHRTLGKAWDLQTAWLATADTKPSLREIRGRVTAVRTFTANPDARIEDTDRQVLAAVADIAETCHSIRPALPVRGLVAATGLTMWQVRCSLDRLETAEILTVAQRGRSAGTHARHRQATLYRMPTAERLATHTRTPVGGCVCGKCSCVCGRGSACVCGVELCVRNPVDVATRDQISAGVAALRELGLPVTPAALAGLLLNSREHTA